MIEKLLKATLNPNKQQTTFSILNKQRNLKTCKRFYVYLFAAIVFVVDSSDKVRLDEAQYELAQLRQSRYLSKVPVVVAANKQDAEGKYFGTVLESRRPR